MANSVELRIVISRANSKQTQTEFFRSGAGDDLVEQRADEFEETIRKKCDEIINRDGGEYTKG